MTTPASLHPFNERELGLLVRHQLNASLNELSKSHTERLFAARQAALNRYPARQAELSLATLGRDGLVWCEEKLRPFIYASALVLTLLAGNQMLDQQREADLEDIDTALLSDELPIGAYLDQGFQSWLADSSRQ